MARKTAETAYNTVQVLLSSPLYISGKLNNFQHDRSGELQLSVDDTAYLEASEAERLQLGTQE